MKSKLTGRENGYLLIPKLTSVFKLQRSALALLVSTKEAAQSNIGAMLAVDGYPIRKADLIIGLAVPRLRDFRGSVPAVSLHHATEDPTEIVLIPHAVII